MLPRERDHPKVGALAPIRASLFSVFSGGLASVLEAAGFSVRGLHEVSCGWRLLCCGDWTFEYTNCPLVGSQLGAATGHRYLGADNQLYRGYAIGFCGSDVF